MRPLLAANWKMNPAREADAVELAGAVLPAAREHAENVEVALFPPFPWLTSVAEQVEGSGVGLGAQDCFWEPAGAFTGEVSVAMLAGWCPWVIIGHSERRQHFGETDAQVARKTEAALAAGLRPIVCVGEREEQFAAGETGQVVRAQVAAAVERVEPRALGGLVMAYEPVWAIGTGRNANPEHAQRTMRLVSEVLGERFGADPAAQVRVLYGGSVNGANVRSYTELTGCQGCLVGGASLKAAEFSAMIASVAGVQA